jgi:hypothetical protein
MKLKSLLPEALSQSDVPNAEAALHLDVDSDLQSFKDRVEDNTAKEKSRTEQGLKSKIKGKTVVLRAAKGYKQAQKDYTINVRDVNIEWHYEDYFIVLRDEKNDDYFTVPGFPLRLQHNTEAPITSLTQNTSKPHPNSPHTVKQF